MLRGSMLVLAIGVSVRFAAEASKLQLDRTPRWPPGITPMKARKLHHAAEPIHATSSCEDEILGLDHRHVRASVVDEDNGVGSAPGLDKNPAAARDQVEFIE